MRCKPLMLLGLTLAATMSTVASSAAFAAAPRIIDLNRASFEELLSFRGIGRLYAGKIIAARPFVSRSELVKRNVLPVPVYLAIRHQLFVTAPTRASEPTLPAGPVPDGMVDLNSASISELAAIPGIGHAYAARIVAGRPYRVELEMVARRIMPLSAFRGVEGRVAVGN